MDLVPDFFCLIRTIVKVGIFDSLDMLTFFRLLPNQISSSINSKEDKEE